jgi:hypothetical protein
MKCKQCKKELESVRVIVEETIDCTKSRFCDWECLRKYLVKEIKEIGR